MKEEVRVGGVYLPGDVPTGVVCWHVHHDKILEVLTQPLFDRVKYIREYKQPEEILVRLKWLHPVQGELPKSVVDAAKNLAAADDSCGGWGGCLDRARKDWDIAVGRCRKAIEKLHALECPGCPWDGETLFPRK